jgi:hypothetical protein
LCRETRAPSLDTRGPRLAAPSDGRSVTSVVLDEGWGGAGERGDERGSKNTRGNREEGGARRSRLLRGLRRKGVGASGRRGVGARVPRNANEREGP